MTRLKGFDIVCLASAAWAAQTKVNCHHIMGRLADNNRVLFVDSIGGRGLTHKDGKQILLRITNSARGLKKVQNNLFRLSPLVAPLHTRKMIQRFNSILLRLQVQRAALSIGMNRPLAWVFNPLMVEAGCILNPRLFIYHCVDEYAENANTDAGYLQAAERMALNRADLVFVTSTHLLHSRQQSHPRVILAENVADVEVFARQPDDREAYPREMANLPRPIIGFVGNLSSRKIDIGLFSSIAAARPQWSFVIIGPTGIGDPNTNLSTLRQLANVHLLGPRQYELLPTFVRAMDVCLIPFQQNRLTDGSLPMKFFEYLALGKPVVSTPLPSLKNYSDYFRSASSSRSFVSQIERALVQDVTAEVIEERVQLANKHTWSARMAQIESDVLLAIADCEHTTGGTPKGRSDISSL